MQARNGSPFRPEALPHCSQKIWTASVAPALPISSLSARRRQPVAVSPPSQHCRKGMCKHTRSSCPYAASCCWSSPQSLAFPAGTISSSAERESPLPPIPYFSFKIFSILFYRILFGDHPEALQKVCCRSGYQHLTLNLCCLF